MSHPLDRPAWNALSSRLAHLSAGGPLALRFRPDVNILGGAADESPEALAALAALVQPGAPLGTVEGAPMPHPPGLNVVAERPLAQMVLETPEAPPSIEFLTLGDADAAEMFALATLTKPGPFRPRSHEMGGFIGVRDEGGRLIAMAGERMKLPGWGEVSGVCTHPDARGRGLARALMGVVIGRALARGERVFLHVYATNTGAIALYERMGFRVRREVMQTVYER